MSYDMKEKFQLLREVLYEFYKIAHEYREAGESCQDGLREKDREIATQSEKLSELTKEKRELKKELVELKEKNSDLIAVLKDLEREGITTENNGVWSIKKKTETAGYGNTSSYSTSIGSY